MPEVVIDVRMLRHAGIGRYVSNVVPRVIARHSDWQFTLLAPDDAGDAAQWATGANGTLVRCRSGIYSLREQFELRSRSPRGASVFWAPHYNVPLFSPTPLVTTIHDVAHLVLGADDSSVGARARRGYARHMLTTVRDRARTVLFNSRFTQSEFTRVIGAPRRGEAIPLGVDRSWAERGGDASPHSKPYLLFVGSVKPHKNLVRLLAAFESLRDTIEHDLVIAGGWKGQRTVDTAALAALEGTGARVRLLEAPSDTDLARFMAYATALVLPSIYEGFGLPALEAMAAGCPCIVSNAASLPEICGDAALYCDPMDPADIARQIQTLVGDATLRARLIAAGRDRAAGFDWDITARRTASAIERVLDEVQ